MCSVHWHHAVDIYDTHVTAWQHACNIATQRCNVKSPHGLSVWYATAPANQPSITSNTICRTKQLHKLTATATSTFLLALQDRVHSGLPGERYDKLHSMLPKCANLLPRNKLRQQTMFDNQWNICVQVVAKNRNEGYNSALLLFHYKIFYAGVQPGSICYLESVHQHNPLHT